MGVLRFCPVAGPAGSLPSMVGAEGLNDPHGHIGRLSLADRIKASAMTSLRVSGFSLLEQWRPEGPQSRDRYDSTGSFLWSVSPLRAGTISTLFPGVSARCTACNRCSTDRCGVNKRRRSK